MGVAVGSAVAVGVSVGSGVGVAVGEGLFVVVATAVGSDVPNIARTICDVIEVGVLPGSCAIPTLTLKPDKTSMTPSIAVIIGLV